MTWPTVALGDLVNKKSPSVDPRRFPTEVFELFSVPAHDRGEPDIVAAEAIGSSKISVEPGDVLLCRIVPHIKRSWVVPEIGAHRQIASGEWMVFRDPRLDPRFLRHFLISDQFHRQYMTTVAGVGGSLLRARASHAASIRVPLPPLPEQRRIASILDQAWAVSRLADKQLESLRELRDALIESAEASSESTDRTVSSIIDRIDSGKSPVCEDREASEGEWGVLKLGAISSGTYRTDGNTKALREDTAPLTHLEVKAGDILLSRKNTPELVGASAYVRHTRSRLLLPDLIFRLVVNADAGVIPAYVQAMLSAPRTRAKLRKIAGGSAASMSNISKARLLLLTVPIASLRGQEELVSSLEKVDELIDAVMTRRIMSEHLANALKARAFKGEL